MFHSGKKHPFAFTLIEIMMVVVIIGIVAAFAIPSYTKMMRKSHFKQAADGLRVIYDAAQLFMTQSGMAKFPYYCGGPACPIVGCVGGCSMYGVDMINDVLNISIIPGEIGYECHYWNIAYESFCTAKWPASAAWPNYFQIKIRTDLPIAVGNPTCSGNLCFSPIF